MPKLRREPNYAVPIRITHEQIQFVDSLAEQIGTSRSQVMKNLFLMGFEDAKTLSNLGVLPTFMKLREWKQELLSKQGNVDFDEEAEMAGL